MPLSTKKKVKNNYSNQVNLYYVLLNTYVYIFLKSYLHEKSYIKTVYLKLYLYEHNHIKYL